jgi:hypothetical protein
MSSGTSGGGSRRALGAILLVQTLILLVSAHAATGDESGSSGDEASASSVEVETWHASTFVSGSMGLRVIDYWSKGSWMRANTLIGGHPITTIVRGDRYVAFDPLRGEGISIRRSSRALADDATRKRPFGNDLEELVDEGGERVENVRLSGVDAAMWRVTSKAQRRTVWVRRNKPVLPLRVETFDRASSQTISLDYANWLQGLEISDAFFDPPAGLTIVELEYDAYLVASAEGPVGAVPVLYPDLLHGGRIR